MDSAARRPGHQNKYTTTAQYHEVEELDNPGAKLVNRRYSSCDILKKRTNLFSDNKNIPEKRSKYVNSYQI